jgi:hypothetical protein
VNLLKKHWFFILLIFIAAVVRFYDLSAVPMDSDELGALFRAEKTQSSFWAHITQGVAIDGHPAGVQTIIWILFKVLHFNEWTYKLIWGLFSLMNLGLFYRFCLMESDKKAAEFSTILMALLYFPVSMSVWVRPYELGLTALLLFLNFRRHSNQIFVGFLLSLTLYTHYFSFLTAIIYLFISDKINIRNFKILFIALLIAAPQWTVFTHQIHEGGLSWLGKPKIDWFVDHLYFTFNQSNLVLLIVILATSWSLYQKAKVGKTAIIAISTWISVLAIGWSYSVIFKPVLQNHVVYFAFPFFLFFLGTFTFSKVPAVGRFLLMSVLLVSLIHEVQFQFIRTSNKYASTVAKIAQDPTLKLLPIKADGPEDILQYLFQKFGLQFQHLDSLGESTDTFLFVSNSGTPDWMLPWLESKFQRVPALGRHSTWFTIGGRIDAFAIKHPPKETKTLTWHIPNDSNVFIELKKLNPDLSRNDWVYFEVIPSTTEPLEFTTALFEPGFNKALNQIDYRFTAIPNTEKLNPLVHVLKLEDIPNSSIESVVRIHIKSVKPTMTRVVGKVCRGNPWQYKFPRTQLITF